MRTKTPHYLNIDRSQICQAEKEFPWGTVRCELRHTHVGPHHSLDTPHEKGVATWGGAMAIVEAE